MTVWTLGQLQCKAMVLQPQVDANMGEKLAEVWEKLVLVLLLVDLRRLAVVLNRL